MRGPAVFGKVLREVRRDVLVVVLTLAFAPAFVLLYHAVFPELSPAYEVAVVDEDRGIAQAASAPTDVGADIAAALRGTGGPADHPLLTARMVATRAQGRACLERRQCSAMLVVPRGFSQAVVANAAPASGAPEVEPADLTLVGDVTQPGYVVAASLSAAAVQEYVERSTGRTGPVHMSEEALGGSGSRSDFELYVPGLMVFAIILLIFLTALTVAREIESGCMRRLRLTRMTATEYLLGTSAVIMLVGALGVLLTFGVAWLCGFRSQGPLWAAVLVLVLVLTTPSVIGVGMMVAAVSRSVAQAFVIANFPLTLLMFFSGAMLPMPRVTWFTLAGHPVGPFEVLAPTHAVTALNRITTLGAGPGDVVFEVLALVLLTVLYLGGGVALLGRSRRRVVV